MSILLHSGNITPGIAKLADTQRFMPPITHEGGCRSSKTIQNHDYTEVSVGTSAICYAHPSRCICDPNEYKV